MWDENSLVMQWLGIWAFTDGGAGSIPGPITKILKTTQCGQGKKSAIFRHISKFKDWF